MTQEEHPICDFDDHDVNDIEICERCQCCETRWEDCWSCGGEGGTDGDELMMEDPMWYGPDDYRKCDVCNGKGGWHVCDCDENGKHSRKG